MNPVFFIHPPKSGGSTVTSFFDLNLDVQKFVNFEWSDGTWDRTRSQFLASGVGGGHQNFGIHRSLKMAVDYCAILRDPLARHISHYWYAHNGKNGEVTRGASMSAVEALVHRGEISLDEWIRGSYGGRNLFVHMLSGHAFANHESLAIAISHIRHHISTIGLCEDMSDFLLRICGHTGMQYPFFIRTNTTESSPKRFVQLSDQARQKFVEDNKLDYELYQFASEVVRKERELHGEVYQRAIESVRAIQREIDKLQNPYIHASINAGFGENYLQIVRQVATASNLDPIEKFIQQAQSRQVERSDLYDGVVDTVDNNEVRGWAVNLGDPARPVPIEILMQGKVAATGLTGDLRPDVAAAGYATDLSGFTVRLPQDAQDGFTVAIGGSTQSLRSSGIWRRGWHFS
jgi:hypothetical protein